jgi:RES domain-containing protein
MALKMSLRDRLARLPNERFSGECWRVTPTSANALAASVSGGRWAPRSGTNGAVPVLYTSSEADGALAEVASYLLELTPIPGPRPLKVSRLAVSTSRTLHLARVDLAALGIDMTRYGVRDYTRTQEIGAVAASLGIDGLIAPSARWPCDNLMIFTDNLDARERLEVVGSGEVEWRAWARAHGLLRA